MPDWLTAALPNESDLPLGVLVVRLVVAAILGKTIAVVYVLTRPRRRAELVPFVATLVLLTVLIAMITQVIGNSVARAFSLVGALSIVRFRTVVDDTRDTAFVIFAVAVGMAIGSGLLTTALVSIPIVGMTAWLLSFWGGERRRIGAATLVVRLNIGLDPEAVLREVLSKYLQESRVLAVNTARQGAALDVTYSVRLKPTISSIALIGEIHRTEGVQGVEWKEPNPEH